jgi:predicted permease
VTAWLQRLLHKGRAEKDLDAELRFHLEQRIEDFVASGLPLVEARRRANLSFGGFEQIKEACREAGFEHYIYDFFRDLQYASRGLYRDRRFAFVAVFSLALGIAATTVMFSVLYNMIVNPFPYRDFQHAVVLDLHNLDDPPHDIARYHYTIPEFLAVRDQNHVFEDVVGAYQLDVLYRDKKGTRRLLGAYVTPNGFSFLGVPPLLGRYFSPDDAKPDAPFVFMMSYQLWQTEFNGDRSILGKTFVLNGRPRTLIGIMPQRFNGYGSSLWLPLNLRPGADGTVFPVKDPDVVWACARLKKGIGLQAAADDVDSIFHRMAQANPGELYPPRFRIVVRTLLDFVVGDFTRVLYVLLAAVSMLLLIACGNVANLLLARATIREREIAVRASLGASRGRLIRQLLVESLMLAAVACLAACLLAYFGLRVLVAIIPRGPSADLFHGRIPEETLIGLNPAVLLFALAIAALTIVVCGLAPALHAVRGNLPLRLFGSGKGAGSGFQHGRLRNSLVIAEVALSIILLMGTGLLMRSFLAMTHAELGFNPAHMLYAWVSTEHSSYGAAANKKLFYEQVVQRVKALPGVTNATISLSTPPLGGAGSDILIAGKDPTHPGRSALDLCGETYFQTLGVRLLRGRLLSEADIDSARHVAVVNETFARTFFGSENTLGQKIKFNAFDELPDTPRGAYFEIVGVVTDFKNRGLVEPPVPEAFLPYSITGFGDRSILATTSVDPKSLLAGVQREIWSVDPNAAVTHSGSIQDFLSEVAFTMPQFGLVVIGAFAGIGLALALIGVFSVMAYTVALRTHEIGVRMALGAQHSKIMAMVLWQGLRLISVGILIGVLASLGLTQFLATQISGVSITDPLTFLAVVILFLAVGLAACLLPALRAARFDPVIALRYE